MPRRGAAVLVAVVAVAVAVGLPFRTTHQRPQAPPVASAGPNIVFILTDDLSWDLIKRRFAPNIVGLRRTGVTFDRYFVADSLCCPSRATIFTGRFPHDTQVLSNTPPLGGYAKFQARGLADKTFAVALHRRGYATSMLGKYLNGYGDPTMNDVNAAIPPGWSDWHVSNLTGYREFNYDLNDNGRVNHYGGPGARCRPTSGEDDYGVDVLARDATSFIDRSRGQPFALEVATFAPHEPYTPAPRNACDFPGLLAPRDPSFNTANTHPPKWLAGHTRLTVPQIRHVDGDFRLRAQDVEGIDALVGQIKAKLAAEHLLDRTYIVFSSDNGYHLGQHRLSPGKMTAFDTDIRVPLIVSGPGVPHGRVLHAVAQNVDLYPTFVQLAGGEPGAAVDGRSLAGLLHGQPAPRDWRRLALVEHRGRRLLPNDPDFALSASGGDPTTYEAIRISTPHLRHFHGPVEAVYVRYRDPQGEREFYDLRRDPFERRNVAASLSRVQRRELDRLLERLVDCHGARACRRAAETSRVRSQTEHEVANRGRPREKRVVAGVELDHAARPAREVALSGGRRAPVVGAHQVRRRQAVPGV
jgi:N-acetylglucosamine-6-sulfatase